MNKVGAALAFSRADAAFYGAVRIHLAKARLRGVVDAGMAPILFSLEERGTLSMSELAAAAFMPRSTMTGIAARLQKRGIVRMAPNPADGRGTVVALTAKGKAVLPKLRGIEKKLDDTIRGALRASEVDGLTDSLMRLATAFGTS